MQKAVIYVTMIMQSGGERSRLRKFTEQEGSNNEHYGSSCQTGQKGGGETESGSVGDVRRLFRRARRQDNRRSG